LAERGAAIVVNDVDAEVGHAVVDEIAARGGVARADDRDVSSFTGGEGAVAAALGAFGRLDIVVNNAGLALSAPIADVTEAQLDRVFGVNFVGPVAVAQAAWPALVASRHGRIVNTVSEAAFDTRMGGSQVGYAAAKAAVWSLTLTLAEAGREHGITVNGVSPAAFTRMNDELFREQGRPDLDLDAMHVARVVAWLVSDDAADVTGRVLHVAGGHHREYSVRREAGTELVERLEAALSAARPTAPS
jgi:NAD(P)-dependent dehydrogenase (short-subunit alcohol dehydrogenase family)